MPLFSDAYRGKKVLVTGHTGFKGSWLVSWLLDLGADVCGYSDGIPTNPSLFELAGLADRIDHRIGDVRNRAALAAVVAEYRPDMIFHLAAQAIVSTGYRDPIDTISTNVVGTAVVLDVMRDVSWPCAGIIITSDKCYENVEWPMGYRETDRLGGRDVYSASKGAAELIVHAYHRSFFAEPQYVRLATARAGNVIGGGDWAADRIVVDCVKAWQKDQPVEVRRPRSTRPWQHVLEPLSGYLVLGADLLKSKTLHGESFNFGPHAEQNRTVVELLSDLSKHWGPLACEPYVITGDIPFHEAGLLKLSCDKALLELRWQPTLTYAECVGLTGHWYRGVLRDNTEVFAITTEQVRYFERLAVERGRAWAHGPAA